LASALAARPLAFGVSGPPPSNRTHLDLRCESVGAELERLGQLGATLVAEYGDHLLLRDPEGNEFCLFGPG
jgi:hypothetical protein